MSKIILEGHIIVPKDELSIVINELEIHKKLTLQEEGCLVFDVTQSRTESTRFDVYEEFVDKAAFDLHQRRVGLSNWGDATKNIERYYEFIDTQE